MSLKLEKISPEQKSAAVDTLLTAAGNIDSEQPAVTFINELLTESEQVTLGRRLLITQLLLEGKSRKEIQEEMTISPNTFLRTRKWLENQLPNYEEIINEHKASPAKNKNKKNWSAFGSFSFTSKRQRSSGPHLTLGLIAKITDR